MYLEISFPCYNAPLLQLYAKLKHTYAPVLRSSLLSFFRILLDTKFPITQLLRQNICVYIPILCILLVQSTSLSLICSPLWRLVCSFLYLFCHMSKYISSAFTLKQPHQFKTVCLIYVPAALTLESLHFAHGAYLCVLCGSHNKEWLLLYRAIVDWRC
jgi:hypothetical protein